MSVPAKVPKIVTPPMKISGLLKILALAAVLVSKKVRIPEPACTVVKVKLALAALLALRNSTLPDGPPICMVTTALPAVLVF